MKISYNWLRDYIDIDLPVDEVARILTDTGLEVEGVEFKEAFPGGLNGIVVGQVLEVGPHPGADRLQCTKVDIGNGEPLDIVCGAPNVAKGQKVVVATVGSTLYPSSGESFKIKKSKIRGEVSEGMLCAEDEIGLGESHDGIMVLSAEATPGRPLREMVEGNDDHVIEIGLTPNRTDAISHIGVARDLAAFLNQKGPCVIKRPNVTERGDGKGSIEIEIEDSSGCPRYSGVQLDSVSVGPSPDWMQQRMRAIGLKPINNVVDITNYVMHETGQPLHAFDAAKIKGQRIVVRRADQAEKFVTLDGVERELHEDDLLIADEDKGMCLAGVFGGADSGVTETTTQVFLESAHFDMVSIRKSAKRHQLSTDSSFRFERGVDPNDTLYALRRAVDLLVEYAGAHVVSGEMDFYPEPIAPTEIMVDHRRMAQLIGKEIPKPEIERILNSLDISILGHNADTWNLSIPTYRVDVTREADVVEEILRIYGYNNIEIPSKMNMVISHRDGVDVHDAKNRIADQLTGMGFTEMMSNSLGSSDHDELADSSLALAVSVVNPLSKDLGVLRRTLLWNGLESIAHNQNRQRPDLKMFEFGSVYFKQDGQYVEQERLSLIMTGDLSSENWDSEIRKTSFYDMRSAVQGLIERVAGDLDVEERALESTIYSQGISFSTGNRKLVDLGIVEADICSKFDVDSPVYFASIDVASVMSCIDGRNIAVRDIPKFPAVRRDLSLLIDKKVTFGEIADLSQKSGGDLLKKVGLFDVYEGKNLPAGKISYAVSFHIQDERKTLTDKVVDKLMNKVQQSLEKELGASLRG